MTKVEILYFEGCPNHAAAMQLVRQVAREVGIKASVEEIEVRTPEDARRLRFLGSPSIRVEGVDVEPAARASTAYAVACRTYGRAGIPARELVAAALTSSTGNRVAASTRKETGMRLATIEKWRTDFNAAREHVRIVALLSPTCLVCQYGGGVIRAMFEVAPKDDPLRGLVAWTPMMATDDLGAADAEAKAFPDRRVSHSWDGDHVLGNAFATTLGQTGAAWDVYLAYAPGTVWGEDEPPAPTLWMHQLPTATGAEPTQLLHAGRFAREVTALLGRDPAAIPADAPLFLHAKGLAAIHTDRTQPTLEEVAAAATRK